MESSQKCCEDLYQDEVYKRSGNSYIYTLVKCESKHSLFTIALRLRSFTLEWFRHGQIPLDENIIVETSREEFYQIARGDIASLRSALKIFYCLSEHKILIFFDHRYMGGTFFAKATTHMIEADPNGIKFPDTSKISFFQKLYSLVKFAFCDFYTLKTMTQSVPLSSGSLKTIQWNYDVPRDCDTKRVFVMYKNFQEIFSRLPYDVMALNTMIPVAFEQREGVYNNIGVIILNVHRYDNLNDLYYKLDACKYHALATNIVSNWGFRGGNDLRRKVDLIMTMFYARDGAVGIQDAIVSYMNKPDYPLYCMSVTYNGQVFTTLTANTDHLQLKTDDHCNILEQSEDIFDSCLGPDVGRMTPCASDETLVTECSFFDRDFD